MNENCNIRNQFWPQRCLLFFLFLLLIIPPTQAITPLNFKNLESKWLCHRQKKIKAFIARSENQKRVGLSGSTTKSFTPNMALYFKYKSLSHKRFWMPEMNFALDIIFLDEKQKIIGIERDVQPAVKGTPIKKIPTTRFFHSKDVVEIHSGASWGKKLKLGDRLNWCY